MKFFPVTLQAVADRATVNRPSASLTIPGGRRPLLYFLAALFPLLPFQSHCAEAEKPLRLLHIGNSFSRNATRYLPALAKAGGKKLDLYGAVIGGCSFERHALHLRQAKEGQPEGKAYTSSKSLGSPLKEQKHVSLPEALAAKEWDIVTIQQVSTQSYRPETFESHASEIIAEVRSTAPKATLYIHQTWAYRDDNPLYKKKSELNPDRMQDLIDLAYQQLATKHHITHFLPSGLGIRTANRSDTWRYRPDPAFDYANPPAGQSPKEISVYSGPVFKRLRDTGEKKLHLDRKHLGASGCYLAGCIWYEILFNDSVVEVDFTPKELTAEQAGELRKMAHQVVANYRAHGLSGSPAAPQTPETDHEPRLQGNPQEAKERSLTMQ